MGIVSVSIIVPIFNVEKYLAECLDSLVKQTMDDIEIIMVNDGSTDGSLKKCKKITDKRIHIYSKENGGVSTARKHSHSTS